MPLVLDKKHLIKIDRFCAWALVFIMIIFFVSGYGMTRGFISQKTALYLHDYLLPVPGGIMFAFHSAFGMHIGLKRWKRWGPIPRFILIAYGLAISFGVIFFALSRGNPKAPVVPEIFDLG